MHEEGTLKHRKDSSQQTSSNKKYYSPNDLLTMEIGLPKYTRNIVREFYRYAKPEINSKDFKIADFGAGTGALAQIWIHMNILHLASQVWSLVITQLAAFINLKKGIVELILRMKLQISLIFQFLPFYFNIK